MKKVYGTRNRYYSPSSKESSKANLPGHEVPTDPDAISTDKAFGLRLLEATGTSNAERWVLNN